MYCTSHQIIDGSKKSQTDRYFSKIMLEDLTEKLEKVFKKIRGYGRLDEENIQAALKEIRLALLEADVNFKVAKDFTEDIRVLAVGREVMDSITPAQQVVKIVYDRLTELMGGAGSYIILQYILRGLIPAEKKQKYPCRAMRATRFPFPILSPLRKKSRRRPLGWKKKNRPRPHLHRVV